MIIMHTKGPISELIRQWFEPSSEKTNTVDSAYSIDLDQSKHAAQANPDKHISPSVDFLLQESLLYTYIPLRLDVSARISLRGLKRPIWVEILRRGHNGGFLAGQLIYHYK